MTDPAFAISDDGARIAYYETGSAKNDVPLVVLAGGPGADHKYLKVGASFDLIAAHRRVVFFDQRGSGASAEDGPDITIETFVEDIDAVRQALGAERVDLVGHSFGGYLAMAYAVHRSVCLRSMALVSSNAPRLAATEQLFDKIFPDRLPAWMEARAKLPERFPARMMDHFHAMEFVSREAYELYVREVKDHTYNVRVNNTLRAQVADIDYSDDLVQLRMPVLVAHGRWDAIIAPSNSFDIHRLIPGSRFEIFERSGHSPFVEQPEAFARMILSFLKEVDMR